LNRDAKAFKVPAAFRAGLDMCLDDLSLGIGQIPVQKIRETVVDVL